MNLAPTPVAVDTRVQPDPIFDAPWDALSDSALLAHLRSPRGVQIDLVVDEGECTPARIDGVLHGEFEFNGERHALPEPIDWLRNPSADIEWHILLHKFYYAAGLGRAWLDSGDTRYPARWAALIDSWIDDTPPGFIAADVTGRRVQNWIYSLQAFVAHGAARVAPVSPAFLRRMLASLHRQVEFLCEHLTPKRNHRTLELYAIFLAGVAFPEMKRAAHWRQFALRETVVNMQADLLPDGVHCELSTDYHHLAVRNWLHVRTLAARHGVAVPPQMDALLERALEFSLHVHKPDGIVPSLSDGDARGFLPLLAQGAELFGRADMRWVATRGAAGQPPAQTLQHFPASGYHVLRSGWGSGPQDFDQPQYLVFDCGPLGEGNHGHFDALSFELAAFGRSLVVDPGRYTYSEAGDINWRVRFRGTAAHNTVCVDGRHQTRYEPKPIKQPSRHAPGAMRHKIGGPAPDTTLLEAAHADGLVLLHGRCVSHEYDAVHERVIVLLGGQHWIVSDRLDAPTPHDYTLQFQLGPEAQGRATLSEQRLDSPQLSMLLAAHPGQAAALGDSWVSPQYGVKHAAPALRCVARAGRARFDTVLLPWRDQAPAARLHTVAVRAADGASAPALRLVVDASDQHTVDTWFHAEAARAWQIDGLDFTGLWLHLRHDAQGRLLRATSHAGATLADAGRPVALTIATDTTNAAGAPR